MNIKNTAFIRSFKAKSFIHVVILDFIYYTILLFAGSFYVFRILPQFLNLLDASDILASTGFSSVEQFTAVAESMSATWLSFKLYTILIALLLFCSYCIFKYLIWKNIQQKKQTITELVKSIGMFALLNLSALVCYILLTVFCYYIFVLESFNIFFFFVLPLLMIYTQNMIHPLFVQTQSLKETAKQFFDVGIKKVYLFAIPYTLMIICLILVVYIVPLLLFLPEALYTVWYILIFVMYFSWTKYYLYLIIPHSTAAIPVQKRMCLAPKGRNPIEFPSRASRGVVPYGNAAPKKSSSGISKVLNTYSETKGS